MIIDVDYSTLEIRIIATHISTAISDNGNPSQTTGTIGDGGATIVISGRGARAWDPNLEELEAALKVKKTNFFPAKARAALPEKRPVQGPPRQPPKHLLHFANSRVWTRRNRPGI